MGGGKQVQTPDGDDVDLVVPDGVHAGDAFEVVIGLETDEEEDEEQSEDEDEEPEAEEVGDGSGSGSRPSRLQYEAAGSEGVGSGSDCPYGGILSVWRHIRKLLPPGLMVSAMSAAARWADVRRSAISKSPRCTRWLSQ
jgi:hypothetical protein